MSVKVPSGPSHISVEVEAAGLVLQSQRCFASHQNSFFGFTNEVYSKSNNNKKHPHTQTSDYYSAPTTLLSRNQEGSEPHNNCTKISPNNRGKGASLKEDREDKVLHGLNFCPFCWSLLRKNGQHLRTRFSCASIFAGGHSFRDSNLYTF